MRISLFFVFVLCDFGIVYGQNETLNDQKASIDFHFGFIDYGVEEYTYKHNYTLGVAISDNFSFGKLSLGVEFRTHNFTEQYLKWGMSYDNELKSKILSIPLIFSYTIRKKPEKRSYFSPVAGVMFNKLIDYSATSRVNKTNVSTSNKPAYDGYASGVFFRLGISYHYLVQKHIRFFVSANVDYSFKPNILGGTMLNQIWSPNNDDQNSLNLIFGIELLH